MSKEGRQSMGSSSTGAEPDALPAHLVLAEPSAVLQLRAESPQRPTVTQGSSPPSPAGLSLGEALKAQEPSQVGRGLALGASPGATGLKTVAGFSESSETPNPK